MSSSDSYEDPEEKRITARSAQLTTQLERFPGFALPEAALHSIPLPPEFEEIVRSALEENQVRTVLPKFFNAVFRRQGVVNKHTIRALESVGESLAHLAREIEGRDRVLEKLTGHINANGEHNYRNYRLLAQFTERLAHEVAELGSHVRMRVEEESQQATRSVERLRSQIENAAGGSQLRIEALLSTTRAITKQLLQLHQGVADLNKGIGKRDSELDSAIHALESRLRKEIDSGLTSAASSAAAASATARAATETVINESASALKETEDRISAQLSGLQRQFEQTIASRDASTEALINERLTNLESRFSSQVTALSVSATDRISTLENRLSSALESLESQKAEIGTTCAELRQAIAAIEQREVALVATVRSAGQNQQTATAECNELRENVRALAEIGESSVKKLEAAEARLAGMGAALDSLFSRIQIADVGLENKARHNDTEVAADAIQKAQTAISDGFYVALEARFRGPRTLIRERQSKYLPAIAEARTRVDYFPPNLENLSTSHSLSRLRTAAGVLDLGCGRGEWLELLRESGIPALGVDKNQFFLQSCRERGLEVVDADLIEFLRSAPAESAAAITCFHVIEHLPVPVFQELVGHVYRILRRGGLAIFETPNPANMLTGNFNFLIDPTHLRPVHPEFARLVMETGGFSSVRLEFMSPYEQSFHVGPPEDPLARRFNDYFYGPQEYAVLGSKP